jgi:dihydropteroate synthase
MPSERIHFVTGRLAEFSLSDIVRELAPAAGFEYSVEVMPITVAALMTTDWIARHIHVPAGTTKVLLPGYCLGELSPVESAGGVPVERGPRDLRRLPDFFGQPQTTSGYGAYDIDILAEINHAPRLPLKEILSQAAGLRADGADLIDVGCDPGDTWHGAAEAVRALVAEGHRVSIDTMNPAEATAAAKAGAELVLSVNAGNRHAARDWGCEVVAVPDVPENLQGLEETVEFLAAAKIPLRIDPVLEPIGFGFAQSLGRYLEVRRRFPDAEMMMGIANLTELTDADSAPINVLLLGICQELEVHSVLTTQVINWARTSVKECALARRLVYHAVHNRLLPKRLEPGLVLLRDAKLVEHGQEHLERLAQAIKDHNYRIFAESGQVHAVTAGLHLADKDPFALFEQLNARAPRPLDPGHAFYLGYEMAKAATALTLGKDYRQDEALDWGFLTVPEQSHRLKRGANARPDADRAGEPDPQNEAP